MTMKKMISLALAVCMALTLAVPAYAADYACDERELFNETVNEYDLLKELNEDYQEAIENNTIQSSQFSEMDEKELDLIVNYQDYFDEQAKLLQTWTDEQLQFMGYTEEQIETIRNYSGSEVERASISSDCSVKAVVESYTHSSSGSKATVKAWFNWNGVHSNMFDDIYAVTWDYPLMEKSSSAYVKYKNPDKGYIKQYDKTPKVEGLRGASITFPKCKTIYHSESPSFAGTYYISGGAITVNVEAKANVLDFVVYSKYGYGRSAVTPSVTFPAGAGISFSSSVDEIGEARGNNSRFL